MSAIDIVILIALAYGFVRGLFRGFFRELAAVLGVILGLWAARAFAAQLVLWLQTWLDYSEQILLPIGYVVAFVVVAVCVNVLAILIEKLLSFAKLGWLSKLGGAVFGAMKIWLILSVLVLIFDNINQYARLVEPEKLSQSVMYEPTKKVVATCLPFFSLDAVKQTLEQQKAKLQNAVNL